MKSRVVAIRYEGSEAVPCEPHRAHGWMPLIAGKPLKLNGHTLRYVRKADAVEALRIALARRAYKPYKLGTRMPPKEK